MLGLTRKFSMAHHCYENELACLHHLLDRFCCCWCWCCSRWLRRAELGLEWRKGSCHDLGWYCYRYVVLFLTSHLPLSIIVTAPAISAGFASIVYLLVKFVVLMRDDPTKWGLYTSPFFFFLVAAVLTMSISGVSCHTSEERMLTSQQFTRALLRWDLLRWNPQDSPLRSLEPRLLSPYCLSFSGFPSSTPVLFATIIVRLFFIMTSSQSSMLILPAVRWYHFFLGPLLWRRQAPADAPEGVMAVPDYRIRKEAAAVDGLDATAVRSHGQLHCYILLHTNKFADISSR